MSCESRHIPPLGFAGTIRAGSSSATRSGRLAIWSTGACPDGLTQPWRRLRAYTPRMPATLFTIGYQGAKLEQVVASLAAANVSVLVDTRETPMSRRVEFRQRALASALGEAGIQYLSVRALGAPKPLRAIAADDWAGFAAGYRERLALAREELEGLVPLVASERVCLLCFEADPTACHRSLLAHEIQRLLDVSAVHLRPGRSDKSDDHERLMALGEVAHDQVEVTVG
jgi:hypothetical protein